MTIQDLKDQGLIIFEGIVGSQAYGIATPTSDVDIKGVFMIPPDKILGFDYIDQVSDEKNDTVYMELGKFLYLLMTNNPNILELLNLPQECILFKDPIFDMILDRKEEFISQLCKNSFGGYAVTQIKKARGLNKKIVKEFDEKRKSVLEFCYVPYGQGSITVSQYLAENDMEQEFCDLVAIPHMRYTYGVYYDKNSHLASKGVKVPLKHAPFKGIVQDLDKSNDVSTSDIPKGMTPSFILQFNKDGYSVYCKEFREYWEWVEKRNQHRFADNMLHGGGYDGKNLAHCHRLLDMAIEIGEGKGINVRRSNRDQLLSIRRGEYSYDDLISEADAKIKRMEEVFDNSSLPETIDKQFVNNLLLEMRKLRYGLT